RSFRPSHKGATAIDADDGARRVRVLHQIDISGGELGGLADASYGEASPFAFVEGLPVLRSPGIPAGGARHARGDGINADRAELRGERARETLDRALDAGLGGPAGARPGGGEARRQYDGAVLAYGREGALDGCDGAPITNFEACPGTV